MKWFFLLLISITPAIAQSNPLLDEKFPIKPLPLPDIPSVELFLSSQDNRSDGAAQHSTPAVAMPQQPDLEPEGEIVRRKTGVIYQRKKSGECSLLIRSECAALVKVIDLDTRRLDSLVWLDDRGVIELKFLPESRYSVVFCQGIRELDGRLIPGWFGAVDGPVDLIRARRGRAVVSLSVTSESPRVVPSSLEEWSRFNPPKSAYLTQ